MKTDLCLGFSYHDDDLSFYKDNFDSIVPYVDSFLCLVNGEYNANKIQEYKKYFNEKGVSGKFIYTNLLSCSHMKNELLKNCEEEYIFMYEATNKLTGVLCPHHYKNYAIASISCRYDTAKFWSNKILSTKHNMKYVGPMFEYIENFDKYPTVRITPDVYLELILTKQ